MSNLILKAATKLVSTTPASSPATILDKNDFCSLKYVWQLDSRHKRMLSYQQTFITDIASFIDNVEQEAYPHSYEDKYIVKNKTYYISYVFCSGMFLEELAADKPMAEIAFKLREHEASGFKYCVARRWDRKWNRATMIAQGAIEI